MLWATWSVALLVVGAVGGWAVVKDKTSRIVGTCGCVFGCASGVYGSVLCLLGRRAESRLEAWNAPFASLNLGLDNLSALFLIPVLVVGAMAGLAALRQTPGEYAANRPREHWLFYNLMLAAVVLTALARNAILFLFAWEVMTVASFMLIENDQRDGKARGGWVYLTAGHLGAACLFVMFCLLGQDAEKLDFSQLKAVGTTASAVFVLACVGFGGKAGLFPFHAWYAESYPQSPGHVGATLSGTVGSMALYGLVRTLDILAAGTPPPYWWGAALTLAGLGTAVAGALRSLSARDLSRLLAWSSVENYGLVATGLGLGLLGAAEGDPLLSLLGFTAAVLHVANHALSKALLFIASASIYAKSGTRIIDRMGGLAKVLPGTASLFLIGGLGAAAVPPLNGFAGEFLLLLAAFTGVAEPATTGTGITSILLIAVAGIAVAGGLAAAAFMKAFGFVFLGTRRSPGKYPDGAERPARLIPAATLALAAAAMVVFSPRILSFIRPTAERLVRGWLAASTDKPLADVWSELNPESYLISVLFGTATLAFALLAAWAARKLMVMRKPTRTAPTWDCGYAAPDSRMQYNASSFARPLQENFMPLVALDEKTERPDGFFPKRGAFDLWVRGIDRAWGYRQMFELVGRVAAKVRRIQTGSVQMYLLYMAAALVALLFWKL